MLQNFSVKMWTVRVLAATVAASSMLAVVALPASAATRRVSGSGSSLRAAESAAEANCRNNFNGFISGGWDFENNGRYYTATATCEYPG
ncbi:hypothetical protein ABJI51_34520 [Amycolatopsis sp. NEAU-NG30]|uniref:Uncharacterized protein n=1 Tax=Amycolatopsis melonis TaxID=3156488 RepID=A0ABV0LPJ5_9PSEU